MVFDALRESFRDKSRDNICAGLQRFGVNARMAARGSGEGSSLGIIDIDGGPIPWVNVRKVVTSGGSYPYGGGGSTTYYTDYGVNVPYRPPNATIKSVRRKAFPLLGQVLDTDWRAGGSDRDSGVVADILRRLGEDAQVREAVMATRDVEITRTGSRSWIISTKTREVPWPQAWNCYQAIARHLIEAVGGDEGQLAKPDCDAVHQEWYSRRKELEAFEAQLQADASEGALPLHGNRERLQQRVEEAFAAFRACKEGDSAPSRGRSHA